MIEQAKQQDPTSYTTTGVDVVQVLANINVLLSHYLSYSIRTFSRNGAACLAGKPDTFLRSGVVEAELVQVGGRQFFFTTHLC